MRIESSEMQMQSSHTFSKEYLSSELIFSNLLTEDEKTVASESMKNERIDKLYEMPSMPKPIFGLLNSFFHRFDERISGQKFEPREIRVHQSTFIEKYQESERLDFATKGCIKTDSGSFDINLNFSMSRSFAIENRVDSFSFHDPLVINFDGDIPDLSRDTFSFDLDNDGESDQISKLGSGSGFLALDKNEDGVINQGSELFGTISGDGFGELSQYDEDKNHWIDENDSIFNKLQIWLKNEDDNEKELVGLGEVGIGAIFLDSAKGEFTYKTETNQTLGEMRSCGVYLKEDGSCGSISQIDFAIKELEAKEPLAKILQA